MNKNKKSSTDFDQFLIKLYMQLKKNYTLKKYYESIKEEI